MKIDFRFDAPRGGMRRLALFIALPVAVVMAAGLFARAYDDSWIKSGAQIDASTLKAMFDEIQARQAGAIACPVGYNQANANGITLCQKPLAGGAVDEVVKVGNGPASFWIDRYEASVWQNADGSGMQYGATAPNGQLVAAYPAGFATNGQNSPANDAYALSKAEVQPSGSITFFQAQNACRASGKRLPSDEEWLAAARGTHDPGADDGAQNGECVTSASGPRATGSAGVQSQTNCVSAWGAQDMIGNLWELTANWHAGTDQQITAVNWKDVGGTYDNDVVVNVGGQVYVNMAVPPQPGYPAETERGGGFGDQTGAGIFALSLSSAPTMTSRASGFRCVIHP